LIHVQGTDWNVSGLIVATVLCSKRSLRQQFMIAVAVRAPACVCASTWGAFGSSDRPAIDHWRPVRAKPFDRGIPTTIRSDEYRRCYESSTPGGASICAFDDEHFVAASMLRVTSSRRTLGAGATEGSLLPIDRLWHVLEPVLRASAVGPAVAWSALAGQRGQALAGCLRDRSINNSQATRLGLRKASIFSTLGQ